MPIAQKAGEEVMSDNEPSPEPLHRAERVFAGILGLLFGAGGGYAVFKSTNQAGTAVFLLAAAAFLLISIQGTALIRFGTASNSIELERRRRRVQEALDQVSEEENPDRAAGIVEGIALAEPRLVPSGLVYERLLEAAIMRLGYFPTRPKVNRFYDLEVLNRDNKRVFIETKCYSPGRSLDIQTVHQAVAASRLTNEPTPVILVANVPLSKGAAKVAFESSVVFPTLWRDESDDLNLSMALSKAFDKIQTQYS